MGLYLIEHSDDILNKGFVRAELVVDGENSPVPELNRFFVWHLFVEQPGTFKGNLGPFFLLFMPLIFFQRRIGRETKLLLLFSSIYAFLWLLTAQHARYLLSILPALAVVAASGLWAWLSLLSRGTGGRIFTVGISLVLATIAIVSLPLFGKYAMAGYGSTVMDTLPLRCLLGLESRDTYLVRHVPNYPVVQFLNQLPGQKKVLFWWNTHPSVYHVQGEGSFLFSPLEPKLMGDDPREIHRLLKESGITHLIVAQFSQDSYLITRPEGEFVRTHLKRVHQKAATVLYEFSAEPLRRETIYYDFLGHIQEAMIRMPGEPSDKASTDYRVITGDDLDHRYSLVTFPPAEVEYSLGLCEWPVLQFAVGQSIPSCSGKGVFEIWLAGENGVSRQIYSRELYAEKNLQDRGWFEERLDLREFAGQQVKILFKTTHIEGSSCLWYCWADPMILSRPRDR